MTNEGITTIAQISIADAVSYSLMGFTVVLATLALLWVVTLIMGRIVKAVGLDKIPAPEAPKAVNTAIPAETIAVITAAVGFATGGQSAIKDIRKL